MGGEVNELDIVKFGNGKSFGSKVFETVQNYAFIEKLGMALMLIATHECVLAAQLSTHMR